MTHRRGLALLLAMSAACGPSSPDGAPEPASGGVEPLIDERRYELPAAPVWAAAQAVVAEDGAVVEGRRPASDGGQIVARRPEGHRVQATVLAMDRQATRVVLAVSPPNGALAATIQARIGERLSLRKAQADLFGETSVETVYPRSLDSSVAAVEETCRALDLEIVRRRTQDGIVRVEARDRESRLVRFALRRIGGDDHETAVMFTAEAARNDALDRLRRAFERFLSPALE